jgi:hypothetical protein
MSQESLCFLCSYVILFEQVAIKQLECRSIKRCFDRQIKYLKIIVYFKAFKDKINRTISLRKWRSLRLAAITILGLLIPLVTLLINPAVAQTIVNSGFETPYNQLTECTNITGAVANGWSDNTCWNTDKPVIEYARDTLNPHSGASSQRVQLKSGSLVQFVQYLDPPFQKDLKYTAKVWLRAQSPIYANIYFRQADAPYTSYSSKLVKLSTQWRQYTVTSVTESTPGILVVTTTSPGTFWIDDVTLESVAVSSAIVPPTERIPRQYFGMHFNYADTRWPNVGNAIGAVRIWDADKNSDKTTGVAAQWVDINPEPGVYNWQGLDARVNAALSRNADVLMVLGGRTPQWASARPDETISSPNGGSPYGPGQAAEPKQDAYWREWVRAVATRYKGKIKYWETWNEPMYKFFYTGTPDKLISLNRQAWQILKQVDPNNQVLSPSGDIGYLDYYLSNGGKNYTDIINYHFYVALPETVAISYAPNVRLMLERTGTQTKPLWNSEAGWLDVQENPSQIPQSIGKGLVARAYILNWANNIKRFYWYTWDNEFNQFRMREADDITLTPAGTAYREVANWLTDSKMEAVRTSTQNTWIVRILGANGKRGYIVWNPDRELQFSIPASWNIRQVRDLGGTVTSIGSISQISANSTPILLEQ